MFCFHKIEKLYLFHVLYKILNFMDLLLLQGIIPVKMLKHVHPQYQI